MIAPRVMQQVRFRSERQERPDVSMVAIPILSQKARKDGAPGVMEQQILFGNDGQERQGQQQKQVLRYAQDDKSCSVSFCDSHPFAKGAKRWGTRPGATMV